MKKIITFCILLSITIATMGQVKVLSNGRVGIGTNNPVEKLEIRGITFISNDAQYIKIDPNGSSGMGSSTGTFVFWESVAKWNNIQAKSFSTNSDIRLKEDILPLENATATLKKLNGYSYYFISDPVETRHREYGVLAQEVEEVLPELVSTAVMEDNQETKLVNYNGFIPFLINGFNEQQALIEKQQSIIEDLQEKVEALERCCSNEDNKSMQEFYLYGNTEDIKVYQNVPNPFHERTTIQCYIPQIIKKAELCVYNMQGIKVKCFTVSERGNVDIQIQAGQLSAGVYTYLLTGDNKTSEAKQMILTK